MRRMLFLLFVSFSAVAQAHPLVDAAERGDLAAVKCLVESGVPVDSRDVRGSTALKEACDEGYPAIAEYLLKNGADVNEADNKGENCFHEAIEEFLGDSKGYPHYRTSGTPDNKGVLEVLLKDPRLDLNAVDCYGRTPLMRFAAANNTEYVARLLAMGASPGEVDRLGRTAMERTTDPTIQKLLKQRGGM
ncbi:MAG: ankyrin repeat domain-containing protein [Vulcanimicrobiota bacterium]